MDVVEKAQARVANFLAGPAHGITSPGPETVTSDFEKTLETYAHDMHDAVIKAMQAVKDSILTSPITQKPRSCSILTETSESLNSPEQSLRQFNEDGEELVHTTESFFPPTSPLKDPRSLVAIARRALRSTTDVLTAFRSPPPSPLISPADASTAPTLSSPTLKTPTMPMTPPPSPATPAGAGSGAGSAVAAVTSTDDFVLPKAIMAAVDDEIVPLNMLKRILPSLKSGEIRTARDGVEAREILLPAIGDFLEVLFLDNAMPGLSGSDLIGIIRANPLWSEIVVIAVTSDSSFSIIDETTKQPEWERRGFDGLLIKGDGTPNKILITECLTNIFQRLSVSDDPKDKRRWITNHLLKK